MLLALALGAYLAWVWVPVWVLHSEVKTVVQQYANLAIHDPNDDKLREQMAKKIESLQDEPVLLDDGSTARQPVIHLSPDQVTWEREGGDSAPMLHVSFEYQRRIIYPFTKTERTKTMYVDMRLDLSRPDWGPAR